MLSLPHWLYALAAFYGVISLGFARRAHRPTCRICAYRECCPIRQRAMWDPTTKHCYEIPKPLR